MLKSTTPVRQVGPAPPVQEGSFSHRYALASFFRIRSPMNHPTPFYFGKQPAYADFVSRNAEGGACRAFDRWVRDGMHALAAADAGWESKYAAAEGFLFQFVNDDGREALLGRLWPSRDRLGRLFPVWFGFRIPTYPAALERLPTLYQDYLDLLDRSWNSLPTDHDIESFFDLAAELRPRTDSVPYRTFVHSTSPADYLESLFGTSSSSHLLGQLIECLQPLTYLDPSHSNLGARLPLGNNPGRSLRLRAWIETIHRIVGRTQAQVKPQYFWSPASSLSSLLTFFFSTPHAPDFASILHSDRESESICDLLSVPNSLDSLSNDSHPFVQDIINESSSLKVFFERLQSVRHKIS